MIEKNNHNKKALDWLLKTFDKIGDLPDGMLAGDFSQPQKPLISTITPCFKGERYLETFLLDIPNQTLFPHFEVVLDHNEPTEKELTLVKSFQERYPNVLKHIVVNPVEPIGTSMNRCIREASSDIVCIWNIDDLRTPDSLEKQVKFLHDNPDYDVVHGNFLIVNELGSQHGKYIDHTQYVDEHPELTRGMCVGPFFAWRKELNEDVGYFDEQLKSGADFDLAIRLCATSKVGCVYGLLGYYLDEGRGASTNGSWKQPVERTVIEVRYGILDKVDPQWRNHARYTDYDVFNVHFNGSVHSVDSLLNNK
jgi:GT2 family glycosyltransferase